MDKKTEKEMTASTILKQIGNHCLVMIGATGLIATRSGVVFRIGRNKKGINIIEIKLEADDTYTLIFSRLRQFEMTPIKELTGVFYDQLTASIGDVTGLVTALF